MGESPLAKSIFGVRTRGGGGASLGSPPPTFVESVTDDDLLYFLLNVGDGDTQVLRLPRDLHGRRPLVVVDACGFQKLKRLLKELELQGLVDPGEEIPLVVATHPHGDHIGGMNRLIREFAERIGEIWEPGAMPSRPMFVSMMGAIGATGVDHLQPTAGVCRYLGGVRLQVLAPSARLRQGFDTFGVDENDASIVLKVEYPVIRVAKKPDGTRRIVKPGMHKLVLGADAQAESWSHVMVDFPRVQTGLSLVSSALRGAGFGNPLNADVLKVAHHGSKNGTHLELAHRMRPALAFVSCGTASGYGFPHDIAIDALREANEPIAGDASKTRNPDDHSLGIHVTADADDDGPRGSIGMIFTRGKHREVWRFRDARGDGVKLDAGERCC